MMKKNKNHSKNKKYGYELKNFFWSLNTGSTIRSSNEDNGSENSQNNANQ